jgi:hypothetical protein
LMTERSSTRSPKQTCTSRHGSTPSTAGQSPGKPCDGTQRPQPRGSLRSSTSPINTPTPTEPWALDASALSSGSCRPFRFPGSARSIGESGPRRRKQPEEARPVRHLALTQRRRTGEAVQEGQGEDRTRSPGLDPVRAVLAQAEATYQLGDRSVEHAHGLALRVTRAAARNLPRRRIGARSSQRHGHPRELVRVASCGCLS